MKRPDLDGFRLTSVDNPDVWLVFQGERHRIAGGATHDALFAGSEQLILVSDIETIDAGYDVGEGSCLVRFDDHHAIYLVTGTDADPQFLHIETYQSFVDFGFAMAKVRNLPAILLGTAKGGTTLSSAPDRAGAQSDVAG